MKMKILMLVCLMGSFEVKAECPPNSSCPDSTGHDTTANLNNDRVQAETDLIKAETENIKAKTESIRMESANKREIASASSLSDDCNNQAEEIKKGINKDESALSRDSKYTEPIAKCVECR